MLKIIVASAFVSMYGGKLASGSEKEVEVVLPTALQRISEWTVKIEASPQSFAVEDKQMLSQYQRSERDACLWLDKVLRELSSRRTWRSVEEVMREIDWTSENECPFMSQSDAEGVAPTALGKFLSRELKILMGKYGESQVPLKQLRGCLARSLSGFTTFGFADKKLTSHHRITLKRFERESAKIFASFKEVAGKPIKLCDPGFTDSEAEEELEDVRDDPSLDEIPHRLTEGDRIEDTSLTLAQMDSEAYVDTVVDRSSAQVFPQSAGFGRPVANKHVVMSFVDADNPCYFVSLDTKTLKMKYSMEGGLTVGYLIHKNLLSGLLKAAAQHGSECMLELRGRMLEWIVTVLRSPLSHALMFWILRNVETLGNDPQPPPTSSTNSLVVAYCLCSCCPTQTAEAKFLQRAMTEALRSAEGITPSVLRFIARKDCGGVVCGSFRVFNGGMTRVSYIYNYSIYMFFSRAAYDILCRQCVMSYCRGSS